ncbi:hypothetical protein LY76DRAFT_598272 [Colletotrichum caudatum]|nr:hypothetical protein LY76DRAFT_598272 [Colletotrichum caudatum]
MSSLSLSLPLSALPSNGLPVLPKLPSSSPARPPPQFLLLASPRLRLATRLP